MTQPPIGIAMDDFRYHRKQVTDDKRDALIRRAYAAGVNIRQIAVRMGVSRTTVYRVLDIVPAGEGGGR